MKAFSNEIKSRTTESKRHDGDSKDILEKSICDMVQRFTEE
jgi:hypothetical protein